MSDGTFFMETHAIYNYTMIEMVQNKLNPKNSFLHDFDDFLFCLIYRLNCYQRYQSHRAQCPTTRPCWNLISKKILIHIWRTVPPWPLYLICEANYKCRTVSLPEIATTFNWSTPWSCTSVLPPSNIWEPKDWPRRWAPSPTPRTWTSSRIWPWILILRDATFSSIASLISCDIPIATRSTSHVPCCICLPRQTRSQFKSKSLEYSSNDWSSIDHILGVSKDRATRLC